MYKINEMDSNKKVCTLPSLQSYNLTCCNFINTSRRLTNIESQMKDNVLLIRIEVAVVSAFSADLSFESQKQRKVWV